MEKRTSRTPRTSRTGGLARVNGNNFVYSKLRPSGVRVVYDSPVPEIFLVIYALAAYALFTEKISIGNFCEMIAVTEKDG